MNVFLDNIQNKFAKFEGRASRKEFWMFQLFFYLLFTALFGVVILVARLIGSDNLALVGIGLVGLVMLALMIPNYAITTRRLHDTGRSGWWVLLPNIPLGIFILIAFLCLDSEPGANKYGKNPKEL